MMTNIVDCPQTPEALAARHAAGGRLRQAERRHHACPSSARRREADAMKPKSVAVVGAAETTEHGRHPGPVA